MPNIQLSKNLRMLRAMHRLTQTHLSALLNISRQAYSNYETNKRTPDLDSLIHIAQIYHITLDELVNQNIGHVISEQKGPYLPALAIQTSDTLYLTEEEADLIMDYRCASPENRTIIKGFLTSQVKSL